MDFRMDSRKTSRGNYPLVELEGEVDCYIHLMLIAELTSLVESGAKMIIVDLTKTDYLDSSALGKLIEGLKRSREADGNMILICPTPRILRVFEITGLNKIFDIFNTEEDALKSIETAAEGTPTPSE